MAVYERIEGKLVLKEKTQKPCKKNKQSNEPASGKELSTETPVDAEQVEAQQEST